MTIHIGDFKEVYDDVEDRIEFMRYLGDAHYWYDEYDSSIDFTFAVYQRGNGTLFLSRIK